MLSCRSPPQLRDPTFRFQRSTFQRCEQNGVNRCGAQVACRFVQSLAVNRSRPGANCLLIRGELIDHNESFGLFVILYKLKYAMMME